MLITILIHIMAGSNKKKKLKLKNEIKCSTKKCEQSFNYLSIFSVLIDFHAMEMTD